ncbi:MAG: geranylgeranylglycerol-phosphate geranylgeranyltransferase [Paludibacteraceae bacterium]|nr:geranylgeranylglycerol-phosphate geranylgeranyltransferase [Paludibacteraceae bacterium]
MDYLKLIRPINLLFMTLLMILMHCCVVSPLLATFGLDSPELPALMPSGIFLLLLFATLFIAAGGYVINDYFDTKIDLINHPDTLIVGHSVTKDQAARIHHISTALGVLFGLSAAFLLRSVTVGLIFLMCAGLLWFYSASYKRIFLLGNLIVALCTALLPLLIAIAHHAWLTRPDHFGELLRETPVSQVIYGAMALFALFAFLLTLLREIIKDMEDINGDRESECHTVPVVIGIPRTKVIACGLVVLTLLAALWTYLSCLRDFPLFSASPDIFGQTPTLPIEPAFASLRYFLVALLLPLVFTVVLVVRAKTPSDFHHASTLVKITMLLGSLYSVLFYLLLAQAQGIPFLGLFSILPTSNPVALP